MQLHLLSLDEVRMAEAVTSVSPGSFISRVRTIDEHCDEPADGLVMDIDSLKFLSADRRALLPFEPTAIPTAVVTKDVAELEPNLPANVAITKSLNRAIRWVERKVADRRAAAAAAAPVNPMAALEWVI